MAAAFALVPDIITVERAKKRFDILLTTDLTSREIVVGKLAARLVAVAEPLLAALPALAVLQLASGLPPQALGLWVAAATATALMVAGVAAHRSVPSLDRQTATSRALVAVLLAALAPALLAALQLVPPVWDFPRWQGVPAPLTVRDLVEFAGMSSPVVQGVLAEERYSNGGVTEVGVAAVAVRHYAAGCLLVGIGSVLLAINSLRTAVAVSLVASKPKGDVPTPKPPVWDHGIAWRDYCRGRGAFAAEPPTWRGARRPFAIALAVGGLLYALDPVYREVLGPLFAAPPAGPGDWPLLDWGRLYLIWGGAMLAGGTFLASALSGSAAFPQEREADTADMLRLTPLSAEDIVGEKLEGHGRAVREGAVQLAPLLAGLALTGHLHPAAAVGLVACLPGLAAFGLALGMACGARAESGAKAQNAVYWALVGIALAAGLAAIVVATLGFALFGRGELGLWAVAALSPAGAPAVSLVATAQMHGRLRAPQPLWALALAYILSVATTRWLARESAALAAARLAEERGA